MKRRIVEVEDKMVYIPLLKTLSVMMQNEAVMAEVLRSVRVYMHAYKKCVS